MACNIGVCGEMLMFSEKNRRFERFVVRIPSSEFGVGVKRLGSKSRLQLCNACHAVERTLC